MAARYKGNSTIDRFQFSSDLRALERVTPSADLVEPFSIVYDQMLAKLEGQEWFTRHEERFHNIAEPWFDLHQENTRTRSFHILLWLSNLW